MSDKDIDAFEDFFRAKVISVIKSADPTVFAKTVVALFADIVVFDIERLATSDAALKQLAAMYQTEALVFGTSILFFQHLRQCKVTFGDFHTTLRNGIDERARQILEKSQLEAIQAKTPSYTSTSLFDKMLANLVDKDKQPEDDIGDWKPGQNITPF